MPRKFLAEPMLDLKDTLESLVLGLSSSERNMFFSAVLCVDGFNFINNTEVVSRTFNIRLVFVHNDSFNDVTMRMRPVSVFYEMHDGVGSACFRPESGLFRLLSDNNGDNWTDLLTDLLAVGIEKYNILHPVLSIHSAMSAEGCMGKVALDRNDSSNDIYKFVRMSPQMREAFERKVVYSIGSKDKRAEDKENKGEDHAPSGDSATSPGS